MYDSSDFPDRVYPIPATSLLRALLIERSYTAHAQATILGYARDTGTLEGLEELGHLEPEDRADADAAFEQGQPIEVYCSHSWEDSWCGRDARWTVAVAADGHAELAI